MHTVGLQADALHRVDFWSWRIDWGQACSLQRSTLASNAAAALAACRVLGHKSAGADM